MKIGLLALCFALSSSCTELAQSGSSSGQAEAGEGYLVLWFPDGMGRGAISGTANHGLFTKEFVAIDLRECGAIEPTRQEGWTHGFSYVSRATKDSHAVVECFKAKTSYHFDAYLVPDIPYSMRAMDAAPFQDLADQASKPPGK